MNREQLEKLKPKPWRQTHSQNDYPKVVVEARHTMLSYQRPQGKTNQMIDSYTMSRLELLFGRLCRDNINEELKNKYRESLLEAFNILPSELNDEKKAIFVSELSEALIRYFKSIGQKEILIPNMLEELKVLLEKSNLPIEAVKELAFTNDSVKQQKIEEKHYTEEELFELMKEELAKKEYFEFKFHASHLRYYNHTSIFVGKKSRRVLQIYVTRGDSRSGDLHRSDVIENEEKMWKILENYDDEGFAYITMNSFEIDELKKYVVPEEWEKIKSSVNRGYARRVMLR